MPAAAPPAAPTSARAATEAALARIGTHERVVQAWAHVDAAGALAAADAVDADPRALPLRGLVVGVKAVIDVAGLPVELGTPVHAGRTPAQDAACVALLRAAGAVVLGVTHTAELAGFHPSPTTNPHDAARTPGGSSSGSAAAVAAGMVPVALGTQTAGSIVRPAAFCGVVGYKPSAGLVSRRGVLECAGSLDTVGVLAASVDLAAATVAAMAGWAPAGGAPVERPWSVALVHTPGWEGATPAARAAAEEAAATLGDVRVLEAPAWLHTALDDQRVLQRWETARSLAVERLGHADRLSPVLRGLIAEGLAVDPARIALAVARRSALGVEAARLFAEHDVVVVPSAPGEAPERAATGDPTLAAPWTLLGTPVVGVPWGVGPAGLPLGVQVVAAVGADGIALAAARRLEALAVGAVPSAPTA